MKSHHNNPEMAAGDTQRVWFPEMIERLRSRWGEGMSFEAKLTIKLRDELDAKLQQVRANRHIRPLDAASRGLHEQ